MNALNELFLLIPRLMILIDSGCPGQPSESVIRQALICGTFNLNFT
jgi:hypothetical protein